MKNELIVSTIIGLGVSSFAMTSAEAAPQWAKDGVTTEKCQGIAKKGANDCGIKGGHDCAGQAEQDNDSKEWVYLPEGVCNKIAGGVVYKK